MTLLRQGRLIAGALALFIFSAQSATRVLAQVNRTTCSFNGRGEPCTVNRWAGGNGNVANLAVTWLTDGKQTFYAISSGGVSIMEDNGRRTSGGWSRTRSSFIINSSRGNTTVIPY